MSNWQESAIFHFSGLRDYFGFVTIEDVVSNPRENRKQVAMIELLLADGKGWRTGIAQPDSLQFESPSTVNAQGTSYAHRLSGFYPDTSIEAINMLAAMNGRRYLVIFQDRNGRWRVMGNKHHMGARFFCSMQIQNFEGTAGFSFEFKLQSRFPAPSLLYHPAENAQVFAAANGYTFENLASARFLVDQLQSLSA